MQNFLGSLRSPALFNNIINAYLTFSYILPSFYMAAAVATREGKFDMKMQDFWALKSLNCRSFREASPPGPPPGLRPGPDWDLGGPQTPRRISPPPTQNPGSAPDVYEKKLSS